MSKGLSVKDEGSRIRDKRPRIVIIGFRVKNKY